MNQRSLGWPEEVIQYLVEVRRGHDPTSTALALRTVIDWRILGHISNLEKLDIPTLVTAWDNDPVHPLALAERMVEALPNARFETVASILAFFLNPPMFGDLCHRFLQGLDAQTKAS